MGGVVLCLLFTGIDFLCIGSDIMVRVEMTETGRKMEWNRNTDGAHRIDSHRDCCLCIASVDDLLSR